MQKFLVTWLKAQPYNVRWAINCWLIGTGVIIIETIMFLFDVIDWPIIVVTIIIFFISSLTLYSDEYWNGPRGDK